jgi:hypothetical protein
VEQKVVFEATPIKASKRMLAWLADIFVVFILTVFVFEVAVLPIAKAVSGYANILKTSERLSSQRSEILYRNEVLYYEEDESEPFSTSLEYTSELYLKAQYDSSNENDWQSDAIYNYFIKIKDESVDDLNVFLKEFGTQYYDFDSFDKRGSYKLKQSFIDLIAPLYTAGDELSASGEEAVSNFKENVFLNLYKEVMLDIEKHDLTFEGIDGSYKSISEEITNLSNKVNSLYTVASYLSFFFVSLIYLLFFPLFLKNHKTLGEKIMRVNYVFKDNLRGQNKVMRAIHSGFLSLEAMPLLFFVPSINIGINEAFSLSYILYPALVFLLLSLVDVLFLAFSSFTQSIPEMILGEIAIDDETIDRYEKTKGI